MTRKLAIICVTQSKNVARHANAFKILQTFSARFGKDISLHFILDRDGILSFKDWDQFYQPSLWNNHVNSISHILLPNILACSTNLDSSFKKSSWKKMYLNSMHLTEYYFKPRALTMAESDILTKHWSALGVASQLDHPSLIIEDDAVINESSPLIIDDIIASAMINQVGTYADLCDYSTFYDFIDSDENYLSTRIAITRTLCAYLLYPNVAKRIISVFMPFCLPVDLHYQYLLSQLRQPGLMVNKKYCFKNGSLIGHFPSHININS